MKLENKIGTRETLALLVITISAKVFLSFPRNMALIGASAGWMIVVLTGVISLIGFTFIYGIVLRYPSLSIVEAGRKICGPVLGTIFGIIFFVFFLSLCSLFLREFAESFILAILPNTPISVILLFFLLLLGYTTFLGIETLARVAWGLGPYLLTALVVILAFTIPEVKTTFLRPVLGNGVLPILKGSVLHSSVFAEILLFGFLSPLIRKKSKLFKTGLYSLLISLGIFLASEFFVLTVFNYVAANRLIFPVLQLTRIITLGEFIQRVEAVFVFLWFFTAGIQLGALFYATVISFSEAFHIKEHRPLIFPIGVLIFCLSLFPTSMSQAVGINDFTLSGVYAGVAFVLPALIWLIALIFKKKAETAS